MNPKEALKELKARSEVMASLVEILNLFNQYALADDGSEMESLLESTMEKVALEILQDGSTEQAVNLIFGLASTIIYCSDGEKVQEYIHSRNQEIAEEVERIRRGRSSGE